MPVRFSGSSESETMPMTIYYCWFGGGELSPIAKKCLSSWEKYAPGFDVVRCDEKMFDVESHPWTKAAYSAGKYAYVADYVRFWAIYNFGGAYMDLGSELIRDITPLFGTSVPFSAIEEQSKTATPGLVMAAKRHNPLIGEVLSEYDSMGFSDNPDFLRKHTVNEVFTKLLEKHGFEREDILQKIDGWTLLPSSTFNPVYGFGGYHVKKDTYSIHHYSGSWIEPKRRIKRDVVRKCSPFLGRRLSQILGRILMELSDGGPVEGTKRILGVIWEKVAKGKQG